MWGKEQRKKTTCKIQFHKIPPMISRESRRLESSDPWSWCRQDHMGDLRFGFRGGLDAMQLQMKHTLLLGICTFFVPNKVQAKPNARVTNMWKLYTMLPPWSMQSIFAAISIRSTPPFIASWTNHALLFYIIYKIIQVKAQQASVLSVFISIPWVKQSVVEDYL